MWEGSRTQGFSFLFSSLTDRRRELCGSTSTMLLSGFPESWRPSEERTSTGGRVLPWLWEMLSPGQHLPVSPVCHPAPALVTRALQTSCQRGGFNHYCLAGSLG